MSEEQKDIKTKWAWIFAKLNFIILFAFFLFILLLIFLLGGVK